MYSINLFKSNNERMILTV
uniref:Uncharacterized protein n=1 Tax=Arundo donax TaxID=35708 RepID=A0A0A8Z738_ARUDO